MAYQVIAAVSSAARTTSGNAAVLSGDPGDSLALLLNVTAVSGTTPTLVVSVEWSHDGAVWAPGEVADAFTSVNATGAKAKTFQVKGPYYRIVWTIGGTIPSFTFTVSAYETT